MKLLKEFLERFEKFSEMQVVAMKQAVWLRAYLTLGAAILSAVYFYQNGKVFDNGQLFDLKLAITLAIVEVPLVMFGGVIARVIINESRQQAKEIGEEVGKQLEKIPTVNSAETANQKHINEHCSVLIERYKIHISRSWMHVFTEFEFYNSLSDKEQLLQHFYTGHEELFFFLKQTAELEKEMKVIPKPIQNQTQWREINSKYDEVHVLYRKKITELIDQIDRKSIQLGGICGECKKWYDPKDETFKQLDTKLRTFTMPF